MAELGGNVRERHECVPRGMWNETGARMDRGHDDHDCKFRVLAMPEACKTVSVSPAGQVQAWFLVVGGNPRNRAVVYPIPRIGLLEVRSVVSGVREETQREELQRQVEDDTAEGLVVKTVTDRIFTSLGQWDGRLTARVCPFRVIDRVKREAHRGMGSLTCPCSSAKATGSSSGLRLDGKSKRRSRVMDVRILERSVVDQRGQACE